MAKTSCKMTAESLLRLPVAVLPLAAQVLRLRPAKHRFNPDLPPAANGEDRRDESVAAVHSAADRHHALDGRRAARGLGCLPAVAHLGAASGRLPNYSGTNVLSWRKSGSDGLLGHGTARAAVRPDSWLESDDFHEFLRELDDHSAVCFGSEYRCGRATSP